MHTDDRVLIQTGTQDEYDLGFCTITLLSEHIAEVFVNDGVDMTLNMVQHYHAFLLSHLTAPISLLINKVHSYSYTFEAQRELATLPEIHAIAVVVYNHLADAATRSLAELPRKVEWNLKIFLNKDDALAWLLQAQGAELEGAS